MGGPWSACPSGGFGDVDASGQAECADCEVPQRSHDPGSGSGSDLGFVLLIQGVAQPVKRLDRPLFPDVAGQVGGVCLPGFRAGDAECGDGRDRLAVQVRDVPFDEEHLADVRERQVVGGGQDLDGAGGDPAVAFIGGGMSDRNLAPRQRVESTEQCPPVLLHRKHELAAVLMDVVRGGLHRVQRVRGHDLVFQVDLAEDHRGHRYLVRLLADLCLGGDHRGGGVRADQGREQPDLVPVSVFRAPDRLAVQPHLHQRRRAVLLAASRPAVAAVLNPARFISHVPAATSNAPASASVSTRQIVVFDGGGAGAAPLRRYKSARITGGTSATQPVIAV